MSCNCLKCLGEHEHPQPKNPYGEVKIEIKSPYNLPDTVESIKAKLKAAEGMAECLEYFRRWGIEVNALVGNKATPESFEKIDKAIAAWKEAGND